MFGINQSVVIKTTKFNQPLLFMRTHLAKQSDLLTNVEKSQYVMC